MTARDRTRAAVSAASDRLSSPPVRMFLEFVGMVTGSVLVAAAPNPPTTTPQVAQMVGGAVLGGAAAVSAGITLVAAVRAAVREELRAPAREEAGEEHPRARPGRFQRHFRTVFALLLVVVVLLVAGPPVVGLLRGLSYRVFGCPPATQLRMVAEPETVATARELAVAYERRTAQDGYGCPTARIYVFAAIPPTLAAVLESADGWSGEQALRQVGPTPDVWLASTSHEVATVRTPEGSGVRPIAERFTVARSPLVLAVPAPAAQPEAGWSALVRGVADRGQGVVRAKPTSGQLGLLATALLYDSERASTAAGLTPWPPRSPGEIERRLDAARDAADLPIGDTADLLCRRRGQAAAGDGGPAPAAIIASEQEVARYNAGRPLGGSCGAATPPVGDRRLVALYPTDTGDQDVQFVRLGWSAPAQQRAATAFGDWLRSDAGHDALVRTGLRPGGELSLADPLTPAYGVDPLRSPPSEPVADSHLTAAEASYAAAQRASRLLFLFDTSGSMATLGPGGTRARIAADAVAAGLGRLGRRDEFGLWFFPGGSGTGHTEAVPVGPGTAPRRAQAQAALGGAVPTGGTPLFRAVVDGVATLSPTVLRPAATGSSTDPSAADPIGVRALVVLTDGEDTTRGITAAEAADAVAGRGVRVVVVTLGESSCAGGGLPTIVGSTGGDCVDTDTTTVGDRVPEIVDELRGGG